ATSVFNVSWPSNEKEQAVIDEIERRRDIVWNEAPKRGTHGRESCQDMAHYLPNNVSLIE
ncbi:hypothetical protein AVEN_259190-1, partial [Araneus ventricosus]